MRPGRMSVVWAVAALLGGAACTYSFPKTDEANTFACGTDDDCASGYTCVGGYCTAESGGGGDTFTLTVTTSGAGGGSVTSSPVGISCPGTCSYVFPANTTVALTATPDATSSLGALTGACTATPCSILMDGNKTVDVVFEAVSTLYTLTVTLSGAGGGSVTSTPAGISCPGTCSAQFAESSTVTLAATPDATSALGGFSGACSAAPCAVTMNANAAVTVSFNAVAQAAAGTSFAVVSGGAHLTGGTLAAEAQVGPGYGQAVLTGGSLELTGGAVINPGQIP